MLDEMDGKQARRTGNSSPLGLLFDHGFDAHSTNFIAMVVLKCMGFGDNVHTLIVTSLVGFIFYLTTVEEYYTGHLTLCLGNIVTDGSLMFFLVFVAMGVYGNSFWNDELLLGKTSK